MTNEDWGDEEKHAHVNRQINPTRLDGDEVEWCCKKWSVDDSN